MPSDLTDTGLPVASVLPQLCALLYAGRQAVLQAPPGAGKTTLVPLALLDQDWSGGGTILMLQPRRLAARLAARRMAALLDEEVGETVGYRIRLESRAGPKTRIEVVTEGILTRRLIDDPELRGVAAVIFDEFHERSIHSDLALALCLEAQEALREDIRIVVMSATLDAAGVSKLMPDAPVVTSEGRMFPVEVRHLPRPEPADLDRAMAAAISKAQTEAPGDILAFLPGEPEIERVVRRLRESRMEATVDIAPLYGRLTQDAQDAAIQPARQGRRKIVLATDIAETSLTIEGIQVVVDSGYRRKPRFDPRSGMARLETRRISQAAAEQRRGRAGRLGPGVCYRLWPAAETAALPAFETPEIGDADLAPLALDLARWGVTDPSALRWLDAPPEAQFAAARTLLTQLDALDDSGRITAHGRDMGSLPVHPRLAHMLVAGRVTGQGRLACDIAALLEERDILAGAPDADLRSRLDALRHGDGAVHRGAAQRAKRVAQDLRRRLRVTDADGGDAGELLALAYPERIARRRGTGGRYLLRNGRGAVLPPDDGLAAQEWLAIGALGGSQADARIYLAAPVERSSVEALFADDIETADAVEWDDRQHKVTAVRRRRLGAIVLQERMLDDPPREAVAAAILTGIRRLGPDALPWTEGLRQWQARVAFLGKLQYGGLAWPDVSDETLMVGLEEWLAPFLAGIAGRQDLQKINLGAALHGLLGWEQARLLDDAAPTHLTTPADTRLPLDYRGPEAPMLRVRLQEMLGQAQGPAVAGGRVPVLLHLLSPAGRPVQVTRDLAGFWTGSYAQVRAEMRGRYPKHYWPEDPLVAAPTRRTKKQMDRGT